MKKKYYLFFISAVLLFCSNCGKRCEGYTRYNEYFALSIVNKDMRPIVGIGNQFLYHPDSIKIFHKNEGDLLYHLMPISSDSTTTFVFNYSLNIHILGYDTYNPNDLLLAFDTILYIKYPDGDIDTLREFTIRFSETELAPCIHYEFGIQHDDSLYSSLSTIQKFKIVKR